MDGKTTYHHGDLVNTFRRVAADLLAERGVAGFSLREASRRAGVSHTAATHHFGDVAGLLTAVAIEGFEILAAETAAAASHPDPVEAMAAMGQAYVRVGVRHPGHCAVMFGTDVIDATDPAWQRAADAAHAVLLATVQRVADERNPSLDVAVAASTCWAAVQGLLALQPVITLKAVGPDEVPPTLEALAGRVTRQLADWAAGGA